MINAERILIIDDEPKIRTLFRQCLNESGYKSLTALIENADAYYYKSDSLSVLIDKIEKLRDIGQV